MAVTIDSNYTANYSKLITSLAERKSKLKGLFQEEVARGEKHFFDRVGNLTVTERTNRFADVTLQDAPHSRRMANIQLFESAVALDSIDKVRMIMDPLNEYANKQANALGRKFDDVVLAAMIGDAATGVAGAGTQSFTAGNIVAEAFGGHATDGMAVDKLIEARRILAASNVDGGELYCAITPQGISDLLNETKVGSADYNNVRALVSGEVDTFMGIKFIQITGTDNATLNIDSNSKRALLFTSDAMKVAVPAQINVRMDEIPQGGYYVQLYASMAVGAVRMEEEKVVSILHAF